MQYVKYNFFILNIIRYDLTHWVKIGLIENP